VYTGDSLAHKAQQRATERARLARCHQRLKNAVIRRYVEDRLQRGWSPELIAGRLKLRSPRQAISHEAISQWVYAEARHLIPRLARAHRRRKPRGYSRRHKTPHIPARVSIRQRPAAVLTRRQAGHWETDTMLSRTSVVALQVTAYLSLLDLGVVGLVPRDVALAAAREAEGTAPNAVAELLGSTARLVLWQLPVVCLAALGIWLLVPGSWSGLRGPFAAWTWAMWGSGAALSAAALDDAPLLIAAATAVLFVLFVPWCVAMGRRLGQSR
jgi:hypothetical protein